MALSEQLKATLDATQEMIDSEEMVKIIKSTARLTYIFYKELIELGIDDKAAVEIAAAFASSAKPSS